MMYARRTIVHKQRNTPVKIVAKVEEYFFKMVSCRGGKTFSSVRVPIIEYLMHTCAECIYTLEYDTYVALCGVRLWRCLPFEQQALSHTIYVESSVEHLTTVPSMGRGGRAPTSIHHSKCSGPDFSTSRGREAQKQCCTI
jgi:hypothetical protein